QRCRGSCSPAALLWSLTRKSHRPASIAPFSRARTAPSPTRVVLRPGPCRLTRRGPATLSLSSLSALMDCLVTGGAGFIGSNLVAALVDRLDRGRPGRRGEGPADARGPPDPSARALRAVEARRRGLLRAAHAAPRPLHGVAS